jgi:hypothetical protein
MRAIPSVPRCSASSLDREQGPISERIVEAGLAVGCLSCSRNGKMGSAQLGKRQWKWREKGRDVVHGRLARVL